QVMSAPDESGISTNFTGDRETIDCCVLCYQPNHIKRTVIIECGHVAHRNCLLNFVEFGNTISGKSPIVCPVCKFSFGDESIRDEANQLLPIIYAFGPTGQPSQYVGALTMDLGEYFGEIVGLLVTAQWLLLTSKHLELALKTEGIRDEYLQDIFMERKKLLKRCHAYLSTEKEYYAAKDRIYAAVELTAAAASSDSNDRSSAEDDLRDESDQEVLMMDDIEIIEEISDDTVVELLEDSAFADHMAQQLILADEHLLRFSNILFYALESGEIEEGFEDVFFDRNEALNVCQELSEIMEDHLAMHNRIDCAASPTAEDDVAAATDAASTSGEDSTLCCICFDAISEKKRSVKFNNCPHVFHRLCASSWFESLEACSIRARKKFKVPKTCCTCRAIVSEMIGEDGVTIPITYPFEKDMDQFPTCEWSYNDLSYYRRTICVLFANLAQERRLAYRDGKKEHVTEITIEMDKLTSRTVVLDKYHQIAAEKRKIESIIQERAVAAAAAANDSVTTAEAAAVDSMVIEGSRGIRDTDATVSTIPATVADAIASPPVMDAIVAADAAAVVPSDSDTSGSAADEVAIAAAPVVAAVSPTVDSTTRVISGEE
ncbi:hypothetical protein PENTCL1PPCAC_9668, partial [Pristionchus entomophagus]